MSEEIKFRAWDKKHKIMIPFEQILQLNFDNSGIAWLGCWIVEADSDGDPMQAQHQIIKENLELMQFTGLTDMNGKEIYEGDIVKGVMHQDSCVVKWTDGENGYFPFNASFPLRNAENYPRSNLVIGNIYENPELFKD